MNWLVIGLIGLYGLMLVRMEPIQEKVYVDDEEFWTDDMKKEQATKNTYTF